MASGLSAGSLVCWSNGGSTRIGVVREVSQNAHALTVAFDDGTSQTFSDSSDVLSPLVFPVGQAVKLIATGEIGVVTTSSAQGARRFYVVNLPDGQIKTVTEDGVRPSIEMDPVSRLRKGNLDSTRSTNLKVAATRLHFAHQFDELSSLSNSRVEIKPHQVGVLHRVATTYPHRFILADEVGLGKTIEAGLIIKELKARGLANRVLVLAPSGIVSQWQYELKTKFNQVFAHYKRNSIDWLQSQSPGENVWTLNDNVIASTSFCSWDETRRQEIALAGWDLVVIDEAHHARRTWQGEGKYVETNLYKLASMLADPEQGRAQSVLLLTATPMQLHRFELYSLIELLDPALFPSYRDFEEHTDSLAGLNATAEAVRRWPGLGDLERQETIESACEWLGPGAVDAVMLDDLAERERVVAEIRMKHRLSDVLIRNRKKVVGGFMPRVAARWEVDLTPQEREAYDAVSSYVQNGYARSRATQNNALGFLMAVFQKLNTSSSYALRQSLLRRIERLEAEDRPSGSEPEIEESDLEERPIEDALSGVLGASERSHLDRTEIHELSEIVSLLDRIDIDSKMRILQEKLAEIIADDPDAKVIVFTQFRDTQDYIREHLDKVWQAHIFHGQLKPEDKDAAVARFRDGDGAQALITTEAGGEGRNFQFCNILVNYDLPWNPMKVEQRIGRVDRIGQKRTVKIFNFSTRGTIEERVVEVLTHRIGLFQQTIGGLDPILGEVEHDLRKIFRLAESEAGQALVELERQLESRVQQARVTEQQLADLIMDSRSFRKDEVEKLLDRRGGSSNTDLRRFTINALSELDAKITEEVDSPGVYQLRIGERFLAVFPQFAKEEIRQRITFEPAIALEHEEVDFLAFGHPMVDALVARACSPDYDARAAYRIIITDDFRPISGWLFVYVLELGGLVQSKELLPIFIASSGEEDADAADWLLARITFGKKEEVSGFHPPLPPRDEAFEAAVALAEAKAFGTLLERQETVEAENQVRLEQEKTKLERFYDYREIAERDRLDAVEAVHERVSNSDDPTVLRIVPVWAKNLERAQRALETTSVERERRLRELEGREHVSGQHSRLAAFAVDVHPDPLVGVPNDSSETTGRTRETLRSLAVPTSEAELAILIGSVKKHVAKLTLLAEKHRFDSRVGIGIGEALLEVQRRSPQLDAAGRSILRGAVEYFLLIEDDDHDLTGTMGFEDDRLVANLAFAALGHPDLRVRR